MHYFSFALFTCALGWLMLAAKTRRRIVAVTVAGVLVSTLVIAPPPAEAQAGIIQAIQAVLNVINGAIQTALNAINTTRAAINSLYQNLIWPAQLINQAKAQIVQMINQYRTLMASIVSIDLHSATLATPQSLENRSEERRGG